MNPVASMRVVGMAPSMMNALVLYRGVSIRNSSEEYVSHEWISVKVVRSQNSV